jgi:alpha-1,2-glucosyltransferase
MPDGAALYQAFVVVSVYVLKLVNEAVNEPYMVCACAPVASAAHDLCAQDEPFHVPQAQAYCRGEWAVWDPKLTTPPGLCVPLFAARDVDTG